MTNSRDLQIGMYRIREIIGQGGMGVVYLATDLRNNQNVALKSLIDIEPHLAQSMRREISALIGLKHPNIVQIFDSGVENNIPWYAMELFDGASLLDDFRLTKTADMVGLDSNGMLLETQAMVNTSPNAAGESTGSMQTLSMEEAIAPPTDPPTVETVTHHTMEMGLFDKGTKKTKQTETQGPQKRPGVRLEGFGSVPRVDRREFSSRIVTTIGILGQVARALDYLHSEGLVHCDLKPANILLTDDGRAILVDFGLATRRGTHVTATDIGDAGIAAGTAHYMSPERIEGDDWDARLDLYGLGCLLYESVTGSPPFPYVEVYRILAAHIQEPPRPIDDFVTGVPPALETLIAGLMAKDPRKRIGQANHVVEVLESLGISTRADENADYPDTVPQLYQPSLVERADSIRFLLHEWRESQRGKGRCILLSGESGVGKTRLMVEFSRQVRKAKQRFLIGQCHRKLTVGDSIVPRQPLHGFTRILRAIADDAIAHNRVDEVFGQDAPILSPYMPFLEDLPHQKPVTLCEEASSGQPRDRVFRALSRVLLRFARPQPLVLVLEDLQWADSLTLTALDALNAFTERVPWLIIGVFRSGYRTETLDAMISSGKVTEHSVKRLTAEALPSLVSEMLGMPTVPEALMDYVNRHAEGNPYFVGECIRSAVSGGFLKLEDTGEGWAWESGRSQELRIASIAPSVSQLLRNRLDKLGEKHIDLCSTASILGRDFNREILSHLSGLPNNLLERLLIQLCRLDILESTSDDVDFRFIHESLREAAYESTEKNERIALHRKAAHFMSALLERDSSVDVAQLAWHWQSGQEPEQARKCYFEALEQALQRYAYQEAESFLENGLQLTQTPDRLSHHAKNLFASQALYIQGRFDEAKSMMVDTLAKADPTWFQERCDSERTVGNILFQQGQIDRAKDHYSTALELAQRLGDQELQARALGSIGNSYSLSGQPEQAIAAYEKALNLAGKINDRRMESKLLGLLGCLLQERSKFRQALIFLNRDLEMGRALGDRIGEGVALTNIGKTLRMLGDYSEALSRYREALIISLELGDRIGESACLGNIGQVQQDLGEFHASLASYQRALEIAKEIGDLRLESIWTSYIGKIRRVQGDSDEARDLFVHALALARTVRDRGHEGDVLSMLADSHQARGEIEDAIRLFGEALEIDRSIDDRQGAAVVLNNLGGLHFGIGNLERASILLLEALEIQNEIGDRRGVCVSQGNIASIKADLGHYADAERGYQSAMETASQLGAQFLRCHWLVHLGRIYRLTGRAKEARKAQQEASIMIKDMSALDLYGRSLCELGHLDLIDGSPPRDTLKEVHRIADELSAGQSSSLVKAIFRLDRAVTAWDQQEPLFFGQCIVDFPENVRKTLRQKTLPGPS